MDGKNMTRGRPAEVLKNIFPRFLLILININRNAALQRKGMEMPRFSQLPLGNAVSSPIG
jgi:hypothetical protein